MDKELLQCLSGLNIYLPDLKEVKIFKCFGYVCTCMIIPQVHEVREAVANGGFQASGCLLRATVNKFDRVTILEDTLATPKGLPYIVCPPSYKHPFLPSQQTL